MSDKIILALSFMGDVLIDAAKDSSLSRKRKTIVPFSSLMPWEESKLRKSFLRLLRVGEIQRVVGDDGRYYLELTSMGNDKFRRRFPLFEWRRKKWDGNWCVVSYDVPEKRSDLRKYLKEKLERLGFSMWQKSVYITPYSQIREDLLDWINNRNIGDYVVVSLSKDLTLSDNKDLARKVFGLDRLSDEYQLVFDDWEAGRLTKGELFEEYIKVLNKDPLLPISLLPSSWTGLKIESILFTS